MRSHAHLGWEENVLSLSVVPSGVTTRLVECPCAGIIQIRFNGSRAILLSAQ
jgi:hypothetical protein